MTDHLPPIIHEFEVDGTVNSLYERSLSLSDFISMVRLGSKLFRQKNPPDGPFEEWLGPETGWEPLNTPEVIKTRHNQEID